MITDEEANRRLDQAAAYFEASDFEACTKELLSLLEQPGLKLPDRFNAQTQLVYSARRWEDGEKYLSDAYATFEELKALKYDKRGIALFRSELEVLEEWQEDHSDPEKPLSAPVKDEDEDWGIDYSDPEILSAAALAEKNEKKANKWRQKQR